MNAWKEKVSDKLSRLLADSSSSIPSNLGNDSPIAPSDTETTTTTTTTNTVRPSAKEEPYASEKSVSSYLYSLIPSVGLDVYKSSRRRRELKPFRSLSSKWKTKSFSTRDKQSECKAEQISPRSSKGISEEGESEPHVLERNSCDSVRKESTSQVSASYVSNLLGESSFISSDLYDFLQSSLPNIVRGCQWILLYSTLRDGISLRTLLRKSVGPPGLCLLIVGDMQGAVFGGLLECPLKPTAKRKYQGSNQTFVFTTIYDQPRLFRATGANRYYYLCLNDLLAFGGGGNFALCLDEDLLRGTSGPCDTFGNLCLAHSAEFELKNVEVWGFTHASQYIT